MHKNKDRQAKYRGELKMPYIILRVSFEHLDLVATVATSLL